MTAPVAAPATATVLGDGRYELHDQLGRGGLAVTHRAHDRRLGRWVAVKSLLPAADPEVAAADRTRFVREARALARFHDPGIVRVFEAFEEAGTAHLVTEYLHGRTLAAELTARGRPLARDEALDLAAGIGRALAVVHAAGLLHRDVSPSNVMLVAGADGRAGSLRPVLIDFGLARDVGDVTDVLTRMVTPGFAPPEQYGGDPARSGPPTDVYGLAATLYHGLGGRLPAAAVDRQAGVRLEPLRRLRPDLPRVLCDAVHDGLELDPAHRPQTIAAFLARLGVAEPLPAGVRPTAVPAATRRAPEPGAAPAAARVVASSADPSPVDIPRWPVGLAPAAAPLGPAAPVPPAAPRSAPPAADAGRARRSPRWRATWPLGLLAVAAGGAAPVVGVAAVALVVLPLTCTIGDLAQGRRRLALPWRLLRNAVACAVTTAPALLLAAAGVAVSLLLDRWSPTTTVDDVVAGGTGAVAAGLATLFVAGDRWRFAAGAALDRWTRRALDGRRLTGSGFAAWTLALLALAGALVLRPDLWPLAG